MVRISKEELHLLRENSKQVERLAEHNARLVDELERCREYSSRVEGLEKENKRLAAELGQRLKQQQQDGTPRPRLQLAANSKSTPGPSEPPSTATRIEFDETKMVNREKYQSLITKYNNLCTKYEDLKEAREKIYDLLTAERDKNRSWNSYSKEQEKSFNRKNDKIQRLEEEIQRLRARMNEYRGQGMIPLLDSDQCHGSEVQVAVSSPVKVLRPDIAAKEHRAAGQTLKAGEPSHQGSPPRGDLDLPAHRNAGDALVEDTQFELMEPHHTSTTEGDSDPLSPNKAAEHEQETEGVPADEGPGSPGVEYISSRMVKKRKVPHDSTDRKIKSEVKVETIGSSPIGLAVFRLLNPNESIDLDDIGEKVNTPKKQRRLLELSRQTSKSVSYSFQSARIRSQNYGHGNTTDGEGLGNSSQETLVRRRDSILQPRSTNRQILPRTSDDRAPKKRRIASDDAVGELVEDGEIAAAAPRSRRYTSDTSDRLDDLLAKPSPPKRVLSPAQLVRVGNQQARPSRASPTSGLARELQHTPEEDLEARRVAKTIKPQESHPSSSRGRGQDPAKGSRPSSRGSLRGSAEPSRPLSRAVMRKSAAPVRPSSRDTFREFSDSSRPTSKGTSRSSAEPSRPTSKGTSISSAGPSRPTSKGTTRANVVEHFSTTNEISFLPPRRPALTSTYSAKRSPRRPLETSKPTSRRTIEASTFKPWRFDNDAAEWEMDIGQELLRVRPVNRLSLTDFKVNPNYNQGYDYAFKEVVRDQSARKCLHGCTKPECCGNKFRILAEINRNPDKPRTLSQEEADDMLLDDFLGDNAYKLRNMSKAEKEDLILQAKTREMANKFGRHRHSYQRRTSPPGFWRSEFPTTQEEMADREKAKEIVRDDVAYRYKEAMRPGGAFIFRDE